MNKKPSNGVDRSSRWYVIAGLLILATVLLGKDLHDRSRFGISRLVARLAQSSSAAHREFPITPISPPIERQTRSTVNLRRGPGTSYELVDQVTTNTVLRIIGKSGDWYLTRHNGREVFIASWLTHDLPTVTPLVRRNSTPNISVRRFSSPRQRYTHNRLNVRSGPGTSYRKVGLLAAGDAVLVHGQSGNWNLIKHKGRDAYVASWLVYNSPPARRAQSVQQQPSYSCNCSKTCPQMSSCQEAYFQLNNCGCGRRDGDNDGVPCESICPGG